METTEEAAVGEGRVPTSLDERYGRRRPGRRIAFLVVLVLLGGAALGWLGWAAWVNSNPPVQGEVAAFDVKNSHRVDTTVQLRFRDRYVTGHCLLRATASDHTIVGELDLAVDGREDRQRTATVRTERRATTVEVVRCTAAGQRD